MNPLDKDQRDKQQLRATAEAELAKRMPIPSFGDGPGQQQHELQVHQIELEMQNEALRQAQTALEESRNRYIDLYEFAPVGYLTLTTEGLIDELNLTATTLLGKERKDLLHRGFSMLVLVKDRERWLRHFLSLKQAVEHDGIDLALQRGDGTLLEAQLDCVRATGETGRVRVALTDIGQRKAAEAAQGQQIEELQRFNRAAIDRELTMIELKRQVNALSRELGREPPFALDFADVPQDPIKAANDSDSPASGASR
jgi:PAS domain S-box-containing protein